MALVARRGSLTTLLHPKARSSWLGLRPWMELLPKAYSRAATLETFHAKSLCIALNERRRSVATTRGKS